MSFRSKAEPGSSWFDQFSPVLGTVYANSFPRFEPGGGSSPRLGLVLTRCPFPSCLQSSSGTDSLQTTLLMTCIPDSTPTEVPLVRQAPFHGLVLDGVTISMAKNRQAHRAAGEQDAPGCLCQGRPIGVEQPAQEPALGLFLRRGGIAVVRGDLRASRVLLDTNGGRNSAPACR